MLTAASTGALQLLQSRRDPSVEKPAMEWVGKGIRVNSISPGYTATPMNTRPEMVHQTREFESQTPMQRMAKVEEMAGPALFLASDAASFCTGVDLVVDGGFVCW